MDFLDENLTAYIETHTQDESDVLKELNRETWAKILMPRMLSGHLQGRVLAMLSGMIKPLHILEIGTYTGYSAICLAEGLINGGKLFTIDINEELTEMVKNYIKKAGLENIVVPLTGNATEIIPTLNENFDIVFIDADKENYATYYDLVFDKVKAGGYIIADNVLWSGNVINPEKENEPETKAIMNYNKKIHADKRVENVLFPIRDGLMICKKN